MSLQKLRDFNKVLLGKVKVSNKNGFFMSRIAPLMKRNVELTFSEQRYFTSDGSYEDWAPLQPYTVMKRQLGGTWYGESSSILKETMRLLHAATSRFSLKKGEISLYTKDDIAIIQHYGNPPGTTAQSREQGQIPSRPIMSWRPEITKEVFEETERYLFDI